MVKMNKPVNKSNLQEVKQMAEKAGWKLFTPMKSGAKFDAYQNRIAIIVTETTSKKKKTTFYLTDEVMLKLEMPTYVYVMNRGQIIGIMKAETAEGAYKVNNTVKADGKNSGSFFIHPTAFVQQFEKSEKTYIKPGVYDAYWETGVIQFDTKSKPSEI